MRVLFTGLGSIGMRHLRLLREADGSFDIHAYRSGSSDRETPSEVTSHDDLETALSFGPDFVFVTNPTAMHVETALICARNGCHLFLEKPLSHTMEGVDELLRECNERNLITYIGCQLRFHPVIQRIKSAIDDEELGSIRSFQVYAGSYLPEWRPDRDYRETYSADPELGGGVVLDLIHEIDYTYWLFGDVDSVKAWTGAVSDLGIDTEDLAEIIFEMESGAVGTVHLDYYRPVERRTIEIVGADGVLNGNLVDGSVTIMRDDSVEEEIYKFERDDLFRKQLDIFLSHVQSGTPCKNDLREGKNVLRLALEAKAH